MATCDAWKHKDSMRQCSGDLQYSEESERRAVSSACLVTWLVEDNSFSTMFLMILGTPRYPCSLHDEPCSRPVP